MFMGRYRSGNPGAVLGVTQNEIAKIMKGNNHATTLEPLLLPGVGVVFTEITQFGPAARPLIKAAAHRSAGKLREQYNAERLVFVGVTQANWQQYLKLPYAEAVAIAATESLLYLQPHQLTEYKVGPMQQAPLDIMLVAATDSKELQAKIEKAVGERLAEEDRTRFDTNGSIILG